MRFCSERETRLPVFLKCWPSREPVVEKAQHDPHCFCKYHNNEPWHEISNNVVDVTSKDSDQPVHKRRADQSLS